MELFSSAAASVTAQRSLVAPDGTPLSSSDYKKSPAPALGPSYGQWAGRDVSMYTMPGGGVLTFDLSALTMADFRAMRYHPQINASMSILTFMIHQVDWHVECEDQKIADLVEKNLREIWTRLVRGLGQAFWAGFCVTPETPVLCSDLVWRQAGTLEVGQEIIAFDEEPTLHNLSKAARRYQSAEITRNDVAIKSCSEITTDIGDPITASDDHPWLVHRSNGTSKRVTRKSGPREGQEITAQWPGLCWVQTSDLKVGDKIAFFGKPWETEESRDAGWLAGMFDGEGWLSRHEELNRLIPGWKLAIAQNPGLALDKLKSLLDERGFDYRQSVQRDGAPCESLNIRGGWREILRFLGTVRPDRLLELVPKMLVDGRALNRNRSYDLAVIQSISSVGDKEVASITTSAGTFITGGYLSHNSPCALEYENDTVEKIIKISKVKDLIPESCEVNWKEVKGALPRGAPAGAIPEKHYIYDGIKQHGSAYPIPPENTLWYPLLMENGDFYGRKLLKAAFMPWYFSILIHLFANRYFERHGEPLIYGRAPFDDDILLPDGTTKNGKEVMEDIVTNLRNRSVVVMPSERDPAVTSAGANKAYIYELDLLESQMRGADFERYLARLDEEMSLALFMPSLLMRAGSEGSHNLGVQHTSTWLHSVNAVTGDMKEYIDRYICERLKAYNFTPNAPRCEWMPHKLGKHSVETMRAVISALVKEGQAKPDLEELGMAIGLTLHEVRQITTGDDDGDDDRDRTERDRASDGPRGVGEPRATGAEIAARIKGQVDKAFREGRFGPDFKPTMGYKRRMEQSLILEGHEQDEASSLTDSLYSKMDEWLDVAVGLGMDEYSGSSDFMSMFQRRLDKEIEALR